MARKSGRDRDSKAALLEAAWALLLEQGASGMSVEAIVTRAGLSKGTFFHFFRTKQDLLDAVCARIADEGFRQVGTVLERRDLDPVARLDRYLQASRSWRLERSRAIGVLWRELSRDDNAALMKRVRALGVERTAPILAQLIAEGNDVGLMRVSDADVVARLVVEWMHATVEGTIALLTGEHDAGAVDIAVRRANATMEALERVLGTSAGAFRRVGRAILDRFAADVPRDSGARDEADLGGSSTSTERGRGERRGRARTSGGARTTNRRGGGRHGTNDDERS